VCPFHNNQRDGIHQHTIHKGQAAYQPNSIDNDWPAETPPAASNGGFESYPEKLVDINFVKEVRLSLIISLNRDFITKALHRMSKNMWSMPILLN
jgi:catalase